MKPHFPYLIVDFDSTIIAAEALDELAKLCLRGPRRRAGIKKIEAITAAGMEGKISIRDSLRRRLKILSAHKSQIDSLSRTLQGKVTPSFLRNRDFLRKNAGRIYVITSGFREYVIPVIERLGLLPAHVLANEFRFGKSGTINGFDEKNPLAAPGGKVVAVERLGLKGAVYVIGDGFTDYEIRKAGAAEKFFAFTENVARAPVIRCADRVVKNFDEILKELGVADQHMAQKKVREKSKVILFEAVHRESVRIFEDAGFDVEVLPGALDPKSLPSSLSAAKVMGIRSRTQIDRAVLSQAKELMAVGAFCVGTNQIDLESCSKSGIAAFNAPYSNTRSVVELAAGEIIMLMRRTFESSSDLHRGKWRKSAKGSFEVRGKKLGIVGYGNIGSQLSVLAELLGMQVFYYDIAEKLALGNATKCASLEDLLKKVDIVTLHVDGRRENEGLIGPRELALMKEGALVLNLSRGRIVHLDALAKAIQSGKIAGAAVDVFPHEPAENGDSFKTPLTGLPNVILTPHVGGSTIEAQRNIAEFVATHIVNYLSNGNTSGSVNFPQLDLPKIGQAHRLVHVHKNRPGILAKINSIFAEHRINILGQYLKTNDRIGYVITDVNKKYDRSVTDALAKVPHTIRVRILD